MTSKDFVYWLQGFFELQQPAEIGRVQTELIKKHLALVFVHEIDPSYGDKAHQDKLNKIHKPDKENQDVLSFVNGIFNGGIPSDREPVYRC